MGTIVCVGKLCRWCGKAFAVTKAEMQLARRARRGEPHLCETCRGG